MFFYLRNLLGVLVAGLLVLPGLVAAQGSFNPVSDAAALDRAMRGGGTDEQTVYNILENRTAQQIREIDTVFTSRYGSYWNGGLRAALEDDFQGFNERVRVLTLLQDPAADADLALEAVDGRENGVFDGIGLFRYITENRSKSQIDAMAAAFNSRHSSQFGGRSLRDVIIENFSGDDREIALAILDFGRPSTGPSGGVLGTRPSLPELDIDTTGQTCDEALPPAIWSGGYWANSPPLLPCYGLGCAECGWCGIMILAQRLLYFAMSLVMYVVVPLRAFWGGILIMTSRGNAGQVSRGKEIILQTIVGLMLILGAFLIIQTFLWLIGNPEEVGWPNFICPVELVPYGEEVGGIDSLFN